MATAIEMAHHEVKILWVKMCKAEGVPVNSMFVEFTPENPFYAEYNAAMSKLQALRAAVRNDSLPVPARACTASDMTFGGRCLNCGGVNNGHAKQPGRVS